MMKESVKGVRTLRIGFVLALLFTVMGCDEAFLESEELWVGVIDPSEEGGEALDDEVMLGRFSEEDDHAENGDDENTTKIEIPSGYG